MKNRRNRLIPIILVVIIGVAVTSCGTTTTPSLVGKWQHTESQGYIEFFRDGTFEMQAEDEHFTGTYEETGKNQITLTVGSQYVEEADEYEPLDLKYSFSGNELILDDGISPESFVRAD